jgi:hypothetical protein
MTCRTPPTRKGMGSILDFPWSGVKLPTWFPAFLLAITCAEDVQNGLASSITFQWYKKLLKARGFDLCNCFLKFQESTRTPIPKVGVHLGVWVFIFTLSHTPGLLFWPAFLRTLALVASPRLGLQHFRCVKNNKVTCQNDQSYSWGCGIFRWGSDLSLSESWLAFMT